MKKQPYGYYRIKDKQPEQSKEVLNMSKGDWNNNMHDGNVYCDGLVVANCYSSFLSPATIMGNAKAVSEAVRNTYGKGYNPAAMDELYKLCFDSFVGLQAAQDKMKDKQFGRHLLDRLETALQNSKL